MMTLRFKLPILDFRFPIFGTSSFAKAAADKQAALASSKEKLSQTDKSAIGNRQSKILHLPGGER